MLCIIMYNGYLYVCICVRGIYIYIYIFSHLARYIPCDFVLSTLRRLNSLPPHTLHQYGPLAYQSAVGLLAVSVTSCAFMMHRRGKITLAHIRKVPY